MKRRRVQLVVVAAIITVFVMPAGSAWAGERKYLNAAGRADKLPYTHVVDTGTTVYLSGGIGIVPETGLAPKEVKQEVRLLMEGMKAKLALAGLTMDDLVTVQVFCSDISLYDEFNAIYRTYFRDHYPARAFIGSGKLLRNGRFEIQGIATRK
jgi:2-iminobutanoate/2-iminopropanoate deaminase